MRPSATKLDTLLQRVYDAQNVRLLPREDFASIVACFAAHGDFTEVGDSLIYPVLDKIADASRADSYFIGFLCELSSVVKSNVELSECLPDYVVKAVESNPEGFIQLYRRFTLAERTRAIDLLTFHNHPEAVLPFREIEKYSRDRDLKVIAGAIADSLEVYLSQ